MDVAIQALAAPILTINQPRPPAVTQNVYESSIQRRARHNGRVPAGEKYRWLASVDFQCQRTSRTLVASPRAATLTVSRHHISCSEEKSYRIPSHQQSAVFLRFHFLFIEFGSITNSQCTKVNPYSALRCSCLPSKSYLHLNIDFDVFRFGHSSSVAMLSTGNPSDRTDYMRGVSMNELLSVR
jgi:hypothetical protein